MDVLFAARRASFASVATSVSFRRRRRYSADDFSLAAASAAAILLVENMTWVGMISEPPTQYSQ